MEKEGETWLEREEVREKVGEEREAENVVAFSNFQIHILLQGHTS